MGYVPDRLKGQQSAGGVGSFSEKQASAGWSGPLSSGSGDKRWVAPVGYVPRSRGTAPPPSWSQKRQVEIISTRKGKAPIAPIAAALLRARLPEALRAAEVNRFDLEWARTLVRTARGVGSAGVQSAAASLQSFTKFSGRIAKKTRMPRMPRMPVGNKKAAGAADYLNTLSAAPARKWRAPVGYRPKGSPLRRLGAGTSEVVRRQVGDMKSLAKAGALALKDLTAAGVKSVSEAQAKAEPEEQSALKKLPLARMTKVVLGARMPAALHATSFIGSLQQTCSDQEVKAKEAFEKRWKKPVGYIPERLKVTQNEMGASSAPAKKTWQPPVGYVPATRKPMPVQSEAAPSPAYAAAPAYKAPAAPAASTDPLSSAPAKKWQPYGGYNPATRRSAPGATRLYAAASAAATEAVVDTDGPAVATAKKWEPYGSSSPAWRAQEPAAYAAAEQSPEPASAVAVPPAKKFELYGGYDPKARTPAAAAVAAAAAGASAAPSKPWTVPAGSMPASRAPAAAAAAASGHASTWAQGEAHAPASSSLEMSAQPAASRASAPAESSSLDARLADLAEREACAAQERKAAEEAAAAAAAREAQAVYSAKYSPEIEAQRQERLAFYLDLGVERQEAERMVARIVAAYANA